MHSLLTFYQTRTKATLMSLSRCSSWIHFKTKWKLANISSQTVAPSKAIADFHTEKSWSIHSSSRISVPTTSNSRAKLTFSSKSIHYGNPGPLLSAAKSWKVAKLSCTQVAYRLIVRSPMFYRHSRPTLTHRTFQLTQKVTRPWMFQRPETLSKSTTSLANGKSSRLGSDWRFSRSLDTKAAMDLVWVSFIGWAVAPGTVNNCFYRKRRHNGADLSENLCARQVAWLQHGT